MKPPAWMIHDIKAYILKNREDGVECPCCGQYAKVYKRKLNKNHAKMMLEVWKIQRQNIIRDGNNLNDWVYTPDIPQKSRDFATAQYFGLIEQKPGVRDDGAKQTGWWRLTESGLRFLRGSYFIRQYAEVYNNDVVGFSGLHNVDVDDLWGSYFNYDELMEA